MKSIQEVKVVKLAVMDRLAEKVTMFLIHGHQIKFALEQEGKVDIVMVPIVELGLVPYIVMHVIQVIVPKELTVPQAQTMVVEVVVQ